MRNKLTITISDLNGSKSYQVHQIIKRVLLYFLLTIFAALIIGSTVIIFLNYQLNDLEAKRKELKKELISLSEENLNLNINIQDKSSKLHSISNKISDIEELMGLRPAANMTADERIDLAKLSTQKKAYTLELIPNGFPLDSSRITSSYGYRTHPITGEKEFHRGLDFKAKIGTEILAPADGIIEYAAPHKKSGYGKLVIINHSFGFKTIYGHLSKFKVKMGDAVKKGDIIGLSGNSGISNGPHLHYEIKFVLRNLDPENFVKWNFTNFSAIIKKEKKVKWASLLDLINHQLSNLKQQSSPKGAKLQVELK